MFPKSTPVITRFFAQIRPSHDFTTVVLRSVGIAQLQATIQAKDSQQLHSASEILRISVLTNASRDAS